MLISENSICQLKIVIKNKFQFWLAPIIPLWFCQLSSDDYNSCHLLNSQIPLRNYVSRPQPGHQAAVWSGWPAPPEARLEPPTTTCSSSARHRQAGQIPPGLRTSISTFIRLICSFLLLTVTLYIVHKKIVNQRYMVNEGWRGSFNRNIFMIFTFQFVILLQIFSSAWYGLQLNINISDLSEQWTEHQGHQPPDLAQILMFASK